MKHAEKGSTQSGHHKNSSSVLISLHNGLRNVYLHNCFQMEKSKRRREVERERKGVKQHKISNLFN